MNTFLIQRCTDLKVVGASPQIQGFSRTHPILQKPYFYQGENGRFDEGIEFPVYAMENRAKLTDLIHNVPLVDNLMISPRCYELIKKLNLPEYQVFPIKFIYKGDMIKDYLAFSIVKDISFLDFISWEDSRFYKTLNWNTTIVEEYIFTSIGDVLKHMKEFEDAGFGLKEKIVLRYNNDYDIINFGRYPLPLGFLCSQIAKEQILGSALTGFEFVELDSKLFISL